MLPPLICRTGVLVFVMVCMAQMSWAESWVPASAHPSFLDGRKEGWFWYEDPIRRPLIQPQPMPEIPFAVKVREWLRHVPVSELDLDHLPARILKLLIEEKKLVSLDDPTIESVREYFLVQKAAFARAQRFTNMWQLALYTEPELDYHTEHPVSALGHTLTSQAERQTDDQLLSHVNQQAGLYFFFTSTCPYCQAQAKALKLFADTYGWKVFPVTQDGAGLPEFPQPKLDNGMGERVGVRRVPTILLAIPTERFVVPVGAGLMPVEDLRTRVLAVLKNRMDIREHKRPS